MRPISSLSAVRLGIALTIPILATCSDPTLTSHLEVAGSSATYDNGVAYYLPRATIPISIHPKEGVGFEIQQSEARNFPDISARYVAEWHESPISDDTFTIAVSKSGLLDSINSDVVDRTPDIVKRIIDIATTAAQAAAIPAPAGGHGAEEVCNFDLQIDPFSRDSVDQAYRLLQKCRLKLQVTFWGSERDIPTAPRARDQERFEKDRDEQQKACTSSICFRPVVPIKIRIYGDVGQDRKTHVDAVFIAAVPDLRRVMGYNLVRGACIERKNTLTFQDGLLTKVDLIKPSEVLACLEIPLDIVKALAALPGQLLTVKVNQETAETSLLQQDRNRLMAQQALEQARLDAQKIGSRQ